MKSSQPIALQLWTIRDALASDPDEALRRVRSAGFSAVEIAPLPPELTPERLGELLKRHELSVISIHGELPCPDNVAEWVELARVFHCPKIIWHGWPRDSRFDSLRGIQSLVAACNQAGVLSREHGLQFGMHNHWWEFEDVESIRAIDFSHELLDPEIFWQLDVYWAQTAGADPAQVLQALGTRIGSIHWKDGPAVPGQPMTALGEGKLDLARILRSLPCPVDWVIELDECASDSLEAARKGLEWLELAR